MSTISDILLISLLRRTGKPVNFDTSVLNSLKCWNQEGKNGILGIISKSTLPAAFSVRYTENRIVTIIKASWGGPSACHSAYFTAPTECAHRMQANEIDRNGVVSSCDKQNHLSACHGTAASACISRWIAICSFTLNHFIAISFAPSSSVSSKSIAATTHIQHSWLNKFAGIQKFLIKEIRKSRGECARGLVLDVLLLFAWNTEGYF